MARSHDRDQVGYVYFIASDAQEACKIGFATDPYQRWKTLQTGNPDELVLRMSMPATLGAEKKLHELLKDRRRTLEWFWDRSDFMWALEEHLELFVEEKGENGFLTAVDVQVEFDRFMADYGHIFPESEHDPKLLAEVAYYKSLRYPITGETN